ncbi:hypothetical protein [Kineococcus sp. SYSU DK004]|uniref:hypothetical protein n=1 Tax=Kineococcus sp. SYSU DK004 TaxID=3383125 RepID=UPI003D7CA19D
MSVGVTTRSSMLLHHRDVLLGNRVGKLQLLNLNSPYGLFIEGESSVHAITNDYSHLGLSVETARRAVPLISRRPLYSPARRHLLELPDAVATLPAGPALGMLETSTTELVRALIASVATVPDHAASEALHESLFVRMTTFIQQH